MSEEALRARVAETLRTRGVAVTAALLGLSPETALRVAAGMPVRRGTLALAAVRLESIATGPHYGETA